MKDKADFCQEQQCFRILHRVLRFSCKVFYLTFFRFNILNANHTLKIGNVPVFNKKKRDPKRIKSYRYWFLETWCEPCRNKTQTIVPCLIYKCKPYHVKKSDCTSFFHSQAVKQTNGKLLGFLETIRFALTSL